MGDPPFIGGKEGGNPTSNRCGISYLLKSNIDINGNCTKGPQNLHKNRKAKLLR